MCMSVLPICLPVNRMCARCPGSSESLGNGVTDGCEPLFAGWESNPDPLVKQQVLLTAGLSLQSPYSACVGLLGHQIEIFKPLQQAISTTFSYKCMVLVGWLPHRLKHGLRRANTDVTGKLNLLSLAMNVPHPGPFRALLGKRGEMEFGNA